MKSFTNLTVWQKSHGFTLEIYKITAEFPKNELFGIIPQIRRAAVSIAANIAEGSKRKTDKNFAHFLNIAEGSLEEVKYYLILSRDLRYINEESFEELNRYAEEVGRLLQGFLKKLKA